MSLKKTAKKKSVAIKSYKHGDLLEIENMHRFSAFGKMYLSEKITEPEVGFGKGTRLKNEKIFQSKQLSKTQFLGKQGPGPKYSPKYKNLLQSHPKWSFGKCNKLNAQKSKYDHYKLNDVNLDVIQSKKATYKKSKDFKFRTGMRFHSNVKKENLTPGPIYNIPSMIQKNKGSTFGFRRQKKNESILSKPFGTNVNIGPNSYNPDFKILSKQKKKPIYSFGKNKKEITYKNKNILHETYEDYHSIGKQNMSKKFTESRVKFGKDKRGNSTGIFRQDLTNPPMKLRLPHAYY